MKDKECMFCDCLNGNKYQLYSIWFARLWLHPPSTMLEAITLTITPFDAAKSCHNGYSKNKDTLKV